MNTLILLGCGFCAAACYGADVSGVIVDGLGHPVERALVEICAGYQGLDDYVVVARTNLLTSKDGRYTCTIDSQNITTLQRKVTKAGYAPVTGQVECDETNDCVVLCRKLELSSGFMEELSSKQGEPLTRGVLELLGAEWGGDVARLPLEIFRHGDKLRPALLNAVSNSHPRVAHRAKELLAYAGNTADKDYIVEHGGRLPETKIEHTDLSEAVKIAVEALKKIDGSQTCTILPEQYTNTAGDRVLVHAEFEGAAKRRAHSKTCALVFSRNETKWVFTHYWVTVES